MVKTTLALICVLCLGIVSPLGAREETLVQFDGGIGVIPVSNVVQAVAGGPVTVIRNTVRGVPSPGQIWRIRALQADVAADGRISVRGRGLLLGGGDGIGTNAGQSVFASLFCGNAEFSTDRKTGVPLEANGDFRIDDMLSPQPPADCESPVLLIRNLRGVWFAAGIVKLDDDN